MSEYGAIRLDICEATSEALNEKLGVTTGFKPSEWAENIGVLVKPTSGEVTGDMASFVVTNPIKAISTTIEAVQSGNGTPSPSNVRPISGFDSIKIYRTGKNLFDGSKVTTAYASNWGITWENDELTIEHKTSYTTGTPFCNLALPVGDYIFSYVGDRNSISLYKDGAYSIILNNGTNFSIEAGHTYRIVFSAPANTTKVFSNIMVAVGDTATDYEPYIGHITEIPFGQTVYGGRLNIKTGELTITHKGITVESVGEVAFSTNKNKYYWKIFPDRSVDGANFVSSHFVFGTGVEEGHCYITGVGRVIVATPTDQTLNTKELADAWCAENKPQFVYPLAEEITVQLSPTEDSVRAIAGQNNIWTDCGQVSLSYITL